MTHEELSAILGWSIRTRNGFYCQDKKFKSITYHKDGKVDLNNYDDNYYIINAIVTGVETIKVNGKLAKNVIISQGELF